MSEPTGSTSQTLIGRAQQRDKEAWQRLSYVYAPLVYGWVRRAGLQSSDAIAVLRRGGRIVGRGLASGVEQRHQHNQQKHHHRQHGRREPHLLPLLLATAMALK